MLILERKNQLLSAVESLSGLLEQSRTGATEVLHGLALAGVAPNSTLRLDVWFAGGGEVDAHGKFEELLHGMPGCPAVSVRQRRCQLLDDGARADLGAIGSQRESDLDVHCARFNIESSL